VPSAAPDGTLFRNFFDSGGLTPARGRAITGSIYGLGAALFDRRAPHFYSAPHRTPESRRDVQLRSRSTSPWSTSMRYAIPLTSAASWVRAATSLREMCSSENFRLPAIS